MLLPQPERVPCWQITQAPVESNCTETGTRLSCPVLRPVVSSSEAKAVRTPSLAKAPTAGLSR
ncbi:Uncharacterised protein [Mycobacteroides abscessus subsp. abscessus]|nr:Uncharacterised protein [Mycobacteroides abscessus subsp. abscessus]SIK14108.1 Uncharacterised protein [Mycobacteroides abscessus subsp. abscessus]SIK73238.1 Uncharacterised protein [Mycobacteroides abscessus subsp. abscessus]SKR68099.1 Uncharacterised protein [Mycobacteroides abscessus subsp. abscessus]SKR79290.1 Uncharacterised protein [Mycobacteroides abscessus subsp. abscessus]